MEKQTTDAEVKNEATLLQDPTPPADAYEEHVKSVLSEPKYTETNFFSQLARAGQGTDITIRIKEKNGVYALMVLPEVANKASIKPIVINGSPEELDAGFFPRLGSVITDTCLHVQQVETEKKEDEEKKPVEKPKAKSKPEKQESEPPKVQEQSLF